MDAPLRTPTHIRTEGPRILDPSGSGASWQRYSFLRTLKLRFRAASAFSALKARAPLLPLSPQDPMQHLQSGWKSFGPSDLVGWQWCRVCGHTTCAPQVVTCSAFQISLGHFLSLMIFNEVWLRCIERALCA